MEELEGINQFMTKEYLESPFIRRLIIRNTFVIIETYLYVTKEIIKIKIENSGDSLDWQKLALLNEKRVDINRKGQIETKDQFHSFIPSLRFTLNLFAEVFDAESPDYSTHQFEKLIKQSKRRNQITHPKAKEDLLVSMDEIMENTDVLQWFMTTHSKINQKFQEWIKIIYKE
ncbi:hypothetical protein [Pedobacter boryungensis]|nr:hypothetical protein [Pedobacter boryungensis]